MSNKLITKTKRKLFLNDGLNLKHFVLRHQVLSLYRNLLKANLQVKDNCNHDKIYAEKYIKDQFQTYKSIENRLDRIKLIQDGLLQLKMLQGMTKKQQHQQDEEIKEIPKFKW